jgi:hypothetical protein
MAMTAPFPENGPDLFSGGQTTLGPTEPSTRWAAILEFASITPVRELVIGDVEALLQHLDLWNPSGLWSPDRYAIQLQIPAPTPDQALRLALSYHLDAARSAGLPATTLLRVEVLTYEQFEQSFQEPPETAAGREGAVAGELYRATRSLLAATSRIELADILVEFVTAIGGRIEPGPRRHLGGTTAVDLTLNGDEARHASAESFSMSGLFLEQFLPTLVADARRRLARMPRYRTTKSDAHGEEP